MAVKGELDSPGLLEMLPLSPLPLCYCISLLLVCRKKGHASDDDEEEEVLQMRAIAPSSTAPHLNRIDELSIASSDNGLMVSNRMPRSNTDTPTNHNGAGPSSSSPDSPRQQYDFQPHVPNSAYRPPTATPDSAASEMQSPRDNYQPDQTPEVTPLLGHRPVNNNNDRR